MREGSDLTVLVLDMIVATLCAVVLAPGLSAQAGGSDPKTPRADSASVKATLGRLDVPAEELVRSSMALARKTRVGLRYDIRIARLEEREKILERRRADVIAKADAARDERKSLLERLQREIAELRKEQAGTPGLEAEIAEVQALYGFEVERAQKRERFHRNRVRAGDQHLIEIRAELRDLERRRRLSLEGMEFRPAKGAKAAAAASGKGAARSTLPVVNSRRKGRK